MFLNFLSFYLYNIFDIYFSSNTLLLKSLSSIISNFSCHLTSAFILPSNSATTSFVFPKSFFLSHISCSTINLFYYTKYLTISFIFPLFKIFSTSHSSTPSTFTGFTFSTFCPSTCFLYYTIWLTFTTRWIFIKVGNHNLTALVNITSLILYGPIYWSTNFLTSLFLNTKSFILSVVATTCQNSTCSMLTSAKLSVGYLEVGITRKLDKEPSLHCSSIYINYMWFMLQQY